MKTYSSIYALNCRFFLSLFISFSPPCAPSCRVDLRTQLKILQCKNAQYFDLNVVVTQNNSNNNTTHPPSTLLDLYLYIMLSLKFRPHMATRTPHRQNRTGTVIHGTGLIPQHCKRVKKLYKMTKNLKGALHHLGARAYARNRNVQSAHMCTRRGCWAKNPRAC
jgi:hypothetical protein